MSCEKEAPKQTIRPVKTIQVSQVPSADNQVIFPGTLRAFKRADLSFRVDGIVIIRDITVGQKAKKDEVLLQLDPREYELSLAKAKGKVESIQAELAFAGRDYERMKKIYDRDPGAISVNLLDRRDESNNRLKAELAIAQSDLSKALDDLSYTTLKAPFEGIIAAIYVENHEQVRAKQAVVRFIDTSEREMEINVPEKLINSFLEGWSDLRFNVYLDAFPGKMFSASIKEIGTEASAATQTYPVTLTLEAVPLELSLLAGMSGKAILQQSQKHGDNIFTVPKSAIFTENLNETYVWVVDPSTQMVHKKSVKLMKNATGNQAQVQEGINEGEWVVIAGTSFLSEGQKVKLAAEQSKE
jgi:RND family efflux transporter MFP subunit